MKKLHFRVLVVALVTMLNFSSCTTNTTTSTAMSVQKDQTGSNPTAIANQWFSVIAGYQPMSNDVRLTAMSNYIATGLSLQNAGNAAAAQAQFQLAAQVAMSDPKYCDVTLRYFAELELNQNSIHEDLNDVVALAMYYGCNAQRKLVGGPVMSYKGILTDAVIAIGGPSAPQDTPAYDLQNNSHFASLGNDPTFFGNFGPTAPSLVNTLVTQDQYPGQGVPESGVLTLRQWGFEYLTAGTNRRMVYGVAQLFNETLQFNLKDDNVPDTYVLNMVSRTPGGSSTAYKTCEGCHGEMDALFPRAYAYYDFDNNVVYSPGNVKSLVNKLIETNPAGIGPGPVVNDAWVNYFNSDQNAALGWPGAQTGNGVPAMGEMLSNTTGFAVGAVEFAYETLGCAYQDSNGNVLPVVTQIANDFMAAQYDLDVVFQESVAMCLVPAT